MTPYGEEGMGDVWFDRLWPEWPRWQGEEYTPAFDFYEKDGKYHLTADDIVAAAREVVAAK